VDAERVSSAVTEVLTHRTGSVGADIQQWSGVRRGCRNHNGVFHGAGVFERPHDLRDRGLLLSDRVVNADDVVPLLVDDRVDRDGRLARLEVSDDLLALYAADMDYCIYCLLLRQSWHLVWVYFAITRHVAIR